MEFMNTFVNNSLVFSILIVGVLNTLAFLVFLLLRQRNKIQQDLSRIESQLASLMEASFEHRQQFTAVEKRLSLRADEPKIEAKSVSAESIQTQVSRPEPAKIDVPVLEVENTNRATIDRFRSRAEDDILAALAGV